MVGHLRIFDGPNSITHRDNTEQEENKDDRDEHSEDVNNAMDIKK